MQEAAEVIDHPDSVVVSVVAHLCDQALGMVGSDGLLFVVEELLIQFFARAQSAVLDPDIPPGDIPAKPES